MESHVIDVEVGGKLIETTAEHPFFVLDRGWVAAGELQPGERIQTMDHGWINVDSIRCTDETKTVYNMRVEIDHTYFVGSTSWNFAVWVHNDYKPKSLQNGKFGVELDDNGNLFKDPSTQQVKEFNTQEQAQQFIDNGLVESSQSNNNNAPPASTPVGDTSQQSINNNILTGLAFIADSISGALDHVDNSTQVLINSNKEKRIVERQNKVRFLIMDLERVREKLIATAKSIKHQEEELSYSDFYRYWSGRSNIQSREDRNIALKSFKEQMAIFLKREQDIRDELASYRPDLTREEYDSLVTELNNKRDLIKQKSQELYELESNKDRETYVLRKEVYLGVVTFVLDPEKKAAYDKKVSDLRKELNELSGRVNQISIHLAIPSEIHILPGNILNSSDKGSSDYYGYLGTFTWAIGEGVIRPSFGDDFLANSTSSDQAIWGYAVGAIAVSAIASVGVISVLGATGTILGSATLFTAVVAGTEAAVVYFVWQGTIYLMTDGKAPPPTIAGGAQSFATGFVLGPIGGLVGAPLIKSLRSQLKTFSGKYLPKTATREVKDIFKLGGKGKSTNANPETPEGTSTNPDSNSPKTNDTNKTAQKPFNENPIDEQIRKTIEFWEADGKVGAAWEGAPNRVPGWLSPEMFAEMSSTLKSKLKTATQYGELGDDLFVQGGRAAGKTTGDIDIGIRVSKEKFNELIDARLKSLTPSSDRWKTLMEAKERGRIFAGEIGLSGIRKEIQKILGIDTDLSIILKDGLFDKPPFIPLP